MEDTNMDGTLSDSQRSHLRELLQTTTDARVCRRCGALLSWDQGRTVAEVAREFGVTRQTLYNWRDRLQDGPGRLADRPRSGRPTMWTAERIAGLEHALEHSPRDFGFHMNGWTAGLLKTLLRRAVDFDVSEDSVRSKLHELGYVWKRFRYRLRPDPQRGKKNAHPQCYQ
jgi:transposase